SVAAVIAAPFTAGASLIALAAYKTVKGAYEGGVLGALAGAATVGNAYIQTFTAGALSYDLSYSYDEGFGASVGGGYKLAGGLALGGSISYNEKSGFSGSVGLQMGLTGDNRLTLNAGLNFDQKGFTGADVGLGIGTGAQNKNGDFAGSLDVGLSYDKRDGFGQSIGFSESVNKYVPKGGINVTNTAFGGVTASVSTPSIGGVTGGASYNTKTHGFTASINALGANALNYDLETNMLTGNENFLADMAKAKALAMGGELSEEAKKKLAATMADAHGRYVQGILEANPNNKELADAAGDPDAFQAKVKELDKGGKLNHPSDKFGTVDTGKSRSAFGEIGGFFEDVGRSIAGKEISFGSGYIDEKGNFHQRTCFVAGTKVHTKDGLKNIEDIQVGDVVLSKSDETGEVSYRKVVNTFIRQTDAIYSVSFADGTTLETTWNHPFRVKKQGHVLEKFSIETTDWVQAKDLHPGDVALGADGRELTITDITIEEREETVYNFEVEEYHTYFVGEAGVWVHNDTGYGVGNTIPSLSSGCKEIPSCKMSYSDEMRSGQAGWKLSNDSKNSKIHTQELANGTVNEIEMIQRNGEEFTLVNGKLMEHGDGMVMDKKGKLQVIKKSELGKYISDNKITEAVASTNGIGNSGLDAAQMYQSITGHVNRQDVLAGGKIGATIHLFRDRKVSNVKTWNLDDSVISSSLTTLIDAGAFEKGGTILGHSAGGRTIENGVSNAAITSKINADVFTFGGANKNAINVRVKSWTDIMHKNDKVTGPAWGTKTSDNSKDNYKAISVEQKRPYDSSYLTHSFLGTYQEEFLQYYQRNKGK
ncbi:hypothetical protein EHQ47_04965, partial [Leptospira bourretii]|uniref:polymorphic toxin-type HINT domain-containing protein n=1 Tax=Leptospira bourretii TaxID=2484962 RepID=UPI001100497E